jgi:GxxExxY protein
MGELVKAKKALVKDLYHSQLTDQIIGAAIEVHKHLGPGLLEEIYRLCLAREFDLRGIKFEMEKPLPIEYKGVKLASEYRLDLLVEGKVVVELKSVDEITDVHKAQLLTYMKLTGCKVGLLINFNVSLLVNGLERMVL